MQVNVVDLGIWLALPITGYLILRLVSVQLLPTFSTLPGFTRFALLVAMGMAVWSVPLLGSAVLGVYSGKFFGLAGWIISVSSVWLLNREYKKGIEGIKTNLVSFKLKNLSFWLCCFTAGLLVLAFLYLCYPNESILGGRDMGVYANHGIYIASHGNLSPQYPVPYESKSWSQSFLPGLYATTGVITVQFAHLFPVWLAQSYDSFGTDGLFRLNAVLALVSLGLFFGLLRRFVSLPLAVLGTLFLGGNVSQIWLARITLTEIMTQMWVVAALLTADLAYRDNQPNWARWSGILWGMTSLCRIDSFMFIAFITVTHLIQRCFCVKEDNQEIMFWSRLYQGAIPVFTLALAYYYFFSQPYFSDLLRQLTLIAALTVVVTAGHLMLTLVKKNKLYLNNLLTTKTFWVFAVIVIMAFLYGHLIRPHLGQFSVFNWQESGLHGTRTYREDSLANLGAYLSIPVLYAALGGWLAAVWRIWFLRQWQWLLPVVVAGGAAFIYIYDPNISPDHYWAVRRFVPLILPGFIFFGTFSLAQLAGSFSNTRRFNIVFWGVAIYLLCFTFNLDRHVITHAENKGYWQQLSLLAEKIPNDGIVLAPYKEQYSTPLFMAFNKKIIPYGREIEDEILLKFLQEQTISNKQVYLLSTGKESAFIGYDVEKINGITLTRDSMEATVSSLPKRTIHEEKEVSVFSITKGNIKKNAIFGAYRVYGVPEEGFYDNEIHSSGVPFRWTNGQAKLTVPWYGQKLSGSLLVSILITSPQGADVTIKANGQELYKGFVNQGPWEKNIQLNLNKLETPIKVEINSNSWKPSETIPGSGDQRQLGVAISSIRFLEEAEMTAH